MPASHLRHESLPSVWAGKTGENPDCAEDILDTRVRQGIRRAAIA